MAAQEFEFFDFDAEFKDFSIHRFRPSFVSDVPYFASLWPNRNSMILLVCAVVAPLKTSRSRRLSEAT